MMDVSLASTPSTRVCLTQALRLGLAGDRRHLLSMYDLYARHIQGYRQI